MNIIKLKKMWLPVLLTIGSLITIAYVWMKHLDDARKAKEIKASEAANAILNSENKDLLRKLYSLSENSANELKQSNTNLQNVTSELLIAQQQIAKMSNNSMAVLRGTGFPLVRCEFNGTQHIISLVNDQVFPINHILVTFFEQPYPPVREGYDFFEKFQSNSNMLQNNRWQIYKGEGLVGPSNEGSITFSVDWGTDHYVSTINFKQKVDKRGEAIGSAPSFILVSDYTYTYKGKTYNSKLFENQVRPHLLAKVLE